jgi:hypothetical protein
MTDMDPMQAFYRRASAAPLHKTARSTADLPGALFRLPVIALVGLITWLALRWFAPAYLQNPCYVPESWNCYAGVSGAGRLLQLVGSAVVVTVAWRFSSRLGRQAEGSGLPPASAAAKGAAFVAGFIFLLVGLAIPFGLIFAIDCSADCGGVGFIALFPVGFLWGSGLMLFGAGAVAHERGRAPRLSTPVAWVSALVGIASLVLAVGSVLDSPDMGTGLFWSVMLGLPGLAGITVLAVTRRLRPRLERKRA